MTVQHRRESDAAKRFVTRLAVATALLLFGLKAWAWWHSRSVSLLGSLTDSGLDLVTSSVMFAAVRYASLPADDGHSFGHGKAEAVAALVQGGLTAGSAIFLAWSSISRLLSGAAVGRPEQGIVVSVFGIAATLVLVIMQRRVIARTGSIAVEADKAHYQGDVLLNASVILALGLESYAHLRGADSLFGMAIAIFILVSGYRAARRAWDMLLDRAWRTGDVARLEARISACPDIRYVHALRTRTSGPDRFADFHIGVAPLLSVAEGHRIAHALKARLEADFPDTHFLIHVEPASEEPHDG